MADPLSPGTLTGVIAFNSGGKSQVHLSIAGISGGTPTVVVIDSATGQPAVDPATGQIKTEYRGYSASFQQAPDVNGSPGAWADLGGIQVWPLAPSTWFWFRAVVADVAVPTPATAITPAIRIRTYDTYPMTVSASSVRLVAGVPQTLSVGCGAFSGTEGPAILSATRHPGISASFDPPSIGGNGLAGSSTLTLVYTPTTIPTPRWHSIWVDASTAGRTPFAPARSMHQRIDFEVVPPVQQPA